MSTRTGGVNNNTEWNKTGKTDKMLKGNTVQRLTKSQKKRLKLEKQQEEFQNSLKAKNVETIVYSNPDAISVKQNRQSKAKEQTDSANISNDTSTPGIDIDMRKTRYEIMKFGINSLKSTDLEDAETELAISLGAKPPKRPTVNYKELQEQRKTQRQSEKEADNMLIKPKLNVSMKKKPTREKGGRKAPKNDKGTKRGGGRTYAAGRSSKQSMKSSKK